MRRFPRSLVHFLYGMALIYTAAMGDVTPFPPFRARSGDSSLVHPAGVEPTTFGFGGRWPTE